MLNNKEINNSNEETLCGILLESKLNSECQKNSLCKGAVFLKKFLGQIKELPYIRSKKISV